MSEIVSKSLQKIAKGSAFVFIGTIVSLLLGFLARIIMVRFSTQSEYGVFSLSLTIISICTTVSALGLEEGATRYIAYLRGKNEKNDVQDTISSSIIIVLMASILVTALIYFASDFLAMRVFHDPNISFVLQIMAISIPFAVLINLIVSIFRGFDKASIKVYFGNILRPGVYLLLLLIVVFFNRSFVEMVSTYVISLLITFLILIAYFIKNSPIEIILRKGRVNYHTKSLLRFSIPLLIVSLLLAVMSWTDTLMLGFFKTTETVAAYSAAYPLANLLSPGINSIGLLYVPIISYMYSKNNIKDIGTLNESSTKWCFIITLPIFFILFVFPEFTLNLFYGSQYIKASSVLQILSLGFIVNSFFGLNYYTLTAIGKSRLLMNCSLISAASNIILNLILIPPFGMFGAAIASAISFTLIEIYMTLRLYKFLKIHPFTQKYVRFTILATLLIAVFYIFRNLFIQTLWTVSIVYILFLVTYSMSILITNSLDIEDKKILIQIEEKIITNFPIIKKFINI